MRTITLLSWNVNGIRAAVRNGFVDFLKKTQPHSIGIQEVKIDSVTMSKTAFDFRGYTEYWNPAKRPGYSGIATLVREKSPLKPLQVTNGMGIPQFDGEGRLQTLEFDRFYLINSYFPNANHELSRLGYKLKFNEAFLKYAKRLEKKKPLIMYGDFNVAHQEIDLKNPKENAENAGFTPQERMWMNKFLQAGFIDTFRHLYPKKIQYSWWTYRFNARARNVGWRIDYFLISPVLVKRLKRAYIHDTVLGSDHCPVGIDIAI